MARPLRLEYPGAFYHVMSRGNRGSAIFESDIDRKTFLSLVSRAYPMFNMKVIAFSLMDTHYHMLIRTMEANLSNLMHFLNGVYTQKFNYVNKSCGHVFQGRYKALLVEKENYLLEVTRYIHTNPVRAGIVDLPEDHQWSSHRLYIGSISPPPWFHTDEVLSFFGKDERTSKEAFAGFVQQGVPEVIQKLYNRKRLPAVIGSESFMEVIRNRFLQSGSDDYEIPEAKRIEKIPLEDIAESVARHFGVPLSALLQSKKRLGNHPRRLGLYIARQYGGYPLREIGVFFRIKSYSGVSTVVKRVEREIRDSEESRRMLLRILADLNIANKRNAKT
jgi:putative transposase